MCERKEPLSATQAHNFAPLPHLARQAACGSGTMPGALQRVGSLGRQTPRLPDDGRQAQHSTAAESLNQPASDDGQALPLALLALAIAVLLATVFVLGLSAYQKLSASDAVYLHEYYAADGGIERALAPLATDPAAYAAPTTLTASLNNRTVVANISPAGVQTSVQTWLTGTVTTTVSAYLVTSVAGQMTLTARAEVLQVAGQPTATVRLTAWTVGQ